MKFQSILRISNRLYFSLAWLLSAFRSNYRLSHVCTSLTAWIYTQNVKNKKKKLFYQI